MTFQKAQRAACKCAKSRCLATPVLQPLPQSDIVNSVWKWGTQLLK